LVLATAMSSVAIRSQLSWNCEAHMQRRNFVTSVLVGGLVAPVMGDGHTAENDQQGEQGEHEHGKRNDKGTNYTISFGHWNPTPTNTPTQTSSPIDRFAADPNPRFLNGHDILPSNFRIRVGDTVTFAISASISC
jgi:hypothetical protein